MTCGATVSLEGFLPFTSYRVRGRATTNFSHERYGATLPSAGVQGSRYLRSTSYIYGCTPPKLGVVLSEASTEGTPFCELSLSWLNSLVVSTVGKHLWVVRLAL